MSQFWKIDGHYIKATSGGLENCADCPCHCVGCVDYSSIDDQTPWIRGSELGHTAREINWFNGGAAFPAGWYKVCYKVGCMRLAIDQPFDACVCAAIWDGTTETVGDPDSGALLLNTGFVHTHPCNSSPLADTEANAITYRQGLAECICFYHTSGKIGVYSSDYAPDDNVHGSLNGGPPLNPDYLGSDPTYRLQVCTS